MGAKEAIILMDGDGNGEARLPAFQHGAHAPFARFGDMDGARPVPLHRARDFAGEAAAIVRRVQLHIVDRPTEAAQPLRMMAHGGQDEGDLGLMMLHIGRLVGDLHHQDDAVLLVRSAQGGDVGRQLVAQNGNEQRAVGHSVGMTDGPSISLPAPWGMCLRVAQRPRGGPFRPPLNGRGA